MNKALYPSPAILKSARVSNNDTCLRGWDINPSSTPNPEDEVVWFVCILVQNCAAQLKPPGTKVSTGIAFRITMARKPRHHVKAQLLGRCVITEHWGII